VASTFTVEMENAILDHTNGVSSMPAFGSPRVLLTSVHGGRDAPGQQLTIASGYSGPISVSFEPAYWGESVNSTSAAWDNMPECTVAGYEIWSSDLSLRMWAVSLTGGPKLLKAGSSVIINSGKITLYCTP
jgi:hypothetical protein